MMSRKIWSINPKDAGTLAGVLASNDYHPRGPRGRHDVDTSSSINRPIGRTSVVIAARLHTSSKKVEEARAIARYCTKATIRRILQGELSIAEGYRLAMECRRTQQAFQGIRGARGILESLAGVLQRGTLQAIECMVGLSKDELRVVRMLAVHFDQEGLLADAPEPILQVLRAPLELCGKGAL